MEIKNDFIHALRAFFFFFFFLMLSVNDKTEHLKGNVMYIYNKMVHKNKNFFYGKIIIIGLCIEKSNLLLL